MLHIESSLEMRWKFLQRAFWVHGIDSLAAYLAVGRQFDIRETLPSIHCPVFLAWEENDPTTKSAEQIHELLTCPKTLARFLATEGADGHCVMLGRSLFHQRMFDWLDDVFRTGAVNAK